MRKILTTIAGACALLSANTVSAEEVRIASWGPDFGSLPLYAAVETGAMEEAGIEITFLSMRSVGDIGRALLRTSDEADQYVDAVLSLTGVPGAVATLAGAGLDRDVVAHTSFTNYTFYALAAHPEAQADPTGSQIGVSRCSWSGDVTARPERGQDQVTSLPTSIHLEYWRQNMPGMRIICATDAALPEDGVLAYPYVRSSEVNAALRKGEISYGLVNYFHRFTLEAEGFRVAAEPHEMMELPLLGLFTIERADGSYSDLDAIADAVQRTMEWMQGEPEAAAEWLLSYAQTFDRGTFTNITTLADAQQVIDYGNAYLWNRSGCISDAALSNFTGAAAIADGFTRLPSAQCAQ